MFSKTEFLLLCNDYGMAENTINVWPFDRVLLQEQVHYCHDLFRVDVLVHRHMRLVENFVAGCVVRVRVERHLVVAHLVQHDAERPNITLAVLVFIKEHFRRLHGRIVGMAYNMFVTLNARVLEICDLNLAVLVKENFLGSEHAVNDALIGQIAQDVGNLDEVSPLFLLGHNLILLLQLLNPIPQAFFMLLVDHVHLVVLFKIVYHVQDVLVVQVSHYYRLLPSFMNIIWVHPPKLKYLESVELAIHSRSDYMLNTRGQAFVNCLLDYNVLFSKSRATGWLFRRISH